MKNLTFIYVSTYKNHRIFNISVYLFQAVIFCFYLADGSISGCPSIRANFHQGNIYKDSFVDVWNNGFKEYRNREWARKGQCADCDMFRYCEGSGMHLHDDSGDLITCHYRRIEN